MASPVSCLTVFERFCMHLSKNPSVAHFELALGHGVFEILLIALP
jgi:hypothetical protein